MIYFGWTVSISGNIVIIGSSGSAINGNSGQGSAYIFIQNGNKLMDSTTKINFK
jgi:hypothetical protein